MDMLQFKHVWVEFKKHNRSQESHKKIYNTNVGDLFPYYISNPKSLSKSDSKQLEQYQIFHTLSPGLCCDVYFKSDLENGWGFEM